MYINHFGLENKPKIVKTLIFSYRLEVLEIFGFLFIFRFFFMHRSPF